MIKRRIRKESKWDYLKKEENVISCLIPEERKQDGITIPLHLSKLPIMKPVWNGKERIFSGLKKFTPSKTSKEDQTYFKSQWERLPHFCLECGIELPGYSASFISHILSKGAHPALRHDPDNSQILCFSHHQQWDFGNRKIMKIWAGNKKIVQRLLKKHYESTNKTNKRATVLEP